MQTEFSLIIKMSGLLLLSPPNSPNDATNVLMPAANNLPTHVTWLAFAGNPNGPYCMFPESGFCVVDMNGWALEPVKAGTGTPQTLTSGAANLSHASGRNLASHFLGMRPGRRVRSRVTLRSGFVSNECALATWRFEPMGSSPVALNNVVEWTIPHLSQDRLVLERIPLDPAAGDTRQTIATLYPVDGVIELYIMHVPPDEAFQLSRRVAATASNDAPQQATETKRTPHVMSGTTNSGEATHFHAFYDLLGAQPHERPLPHSPTENRPACPMWMTDVLRQRFRFELTSAYALSCMVASARS